MSYLPIHPKYPPPPSHLRLDRGLIPVIAAKVRLPGSDPPNVTGLPLKKDVDGESFSQDMTLCKRPYPAASLCRHNIRIVDTMWNCDIGNPGVDSSLSRRNIAWSPTLVEEHDIAGLQETAERTWTRQ